MPANTAPVFPNAPTIDAATTGTTADTGYGGSGGTAPTTAVTVATGTTNGKRIGEIVIEPVGATTACMVNLFLFDGTTYWLFDQAQFLTVALAQASPQSRFRKQYTGLVLPSGWSLRATVTVVQTAGFTVTAFGQTY